MCDKLGVPPGMAIAGLGSAVILIGIVVKGYDILIAALTVVYPMWCSVLAIEDNKSDTTTKWLTYWTIYSLFTLVELFVGFIFDFIPYFWVLRLGFFLYLMSPYFNGADTIYKTVLKGLLAQHKDEIEKFFESIRAQGDAMGADALSKAGKNLNAAKDIYDTVNKVKAATDDEPKKAD